MSGRQTRFIFSLNFIQNFGIYEKSIDSDSITDSFTVAKYIPAYILI